ncbi:MAG: hypothetical protein ACE5JX_13840 [Acidobacteriota bacterium]
MNEIVWQTEHWVETDASLGFAWSYWTEVRNWVDPPAQFELDGPFAAGSQGTTLMPGQEPVRWRIREVRSKHSYVLETELNRATLSSEWYFDAVADRRTRLTQRIVLSGDNAAKYVGGVKLGFGSKLPVGMQRIAAAIAAAQAGKDRGSVS